jgi:hypothetical protein
MYCMSFTLPRRASKRIVSVAAAFLALYLWIAQARLDSSCLESTTMTLIYRQIEESPGQYKRFAAFGGDNGDSPISVDAWIDLLSSPAEIVKFVDVIKEASVDYPAFFL